MNSARPSRRSFLQTTSRGAISVAGLSFLSSLPRVSAAEVASAGKFVQFKENLEPLVRLIEETPRNRVLEEIAQKIQHGTAYQEVLAALLCAGVRNVQPRPSVGFKFHAVLVVNSCHLASLHGPDEDRWLPIFWGIDNFKSSQADEAKQTGWKMDPVDEAKVPPPHQAAALFIDAMNRWDVEQADVATAAVARNLSANEVFNLFAQFAARDYRSIGHKAIFLANAWRTLQVIGWSNAEPILRSLAFALLNHEGDPNPARNELEADRTWKENALLAAQLPADWKSGKLDPGFTNHLVTTTSHEGVDAAAKVAAEAVAGAVHPQSIWDAVFIGAGELLMRQPGIVGLHGLTTANAVHYLYQNVADDELRRRLLLQACSFNPQFRGSAQGRGGLAKTSYQSWKDDAGASVNDVHELTAQISKDKLKASHAVQSYLKNGGDPYAFIDAARQQIFLRGTNAHDYKYSAAVLEDFSSVSPAFRDDFLALSVFNLRGSGERVSPVAERTRAAFST